MSLTVREKEHWKTRIEKRIDKQISLIANEHSITFFGDVEKEARRLAEKKFGVDKINTRISKLTEELARLSDEKDACVIGIPIEKIQNFGSYERRLKYQEKFETIVRLFENSILEKDKTGKRILELRSEKEALLDTVWLATSPRQIRELWKCVSILLDDAQTKLQTKAMKFEPMSGCELDSRES